MRRTLYVLTLSLLLGACGAPDEPAVSLYLAIQRGDIEQVERHIYWKSDLNAAFPNGRYPIHDAADKGRMIIVKLLLENQVELEKRDRAGRTPLELAILAGRTQLAEVLIKAGAKHEATPLLLLAARHDSEDRDIVRFLVELGADLDSKDTTGDTPLIIATRRGNHRLVHHLVENGANVNTRNSKGESPLDVASTVGALQIEQLLLRNGAERRE